MKKGKSRAYSPWGIRMVTANCTNCQNLARDLHTVEVECIHWRLRYEEEHDRHAATVATLLKIQGFAATAVNADVLGPKPGELTVGQRITDEWVRANHEELVNGWPRCRVCGAALDVGDFVDGQWPYNSENNRHASCAALPRKGEEDA